VPGPLDDATVDELNWLAAACFRVVGALDVSRIDFRLDANNHDKPYILEINPLPGLSPGISDIVIEAAADGIDHTRLVNDPGNRLAPLWHALKWGGKGCD
jgi:D-alanine-D-alanine ligase